MINENFVSENIAYDDTIWAGITKTGEIIKETTKDGRIRDFSEINDNVNNFTKFGFMGNTVFNYLDLETKKFELNNLSIELDLFKNDVSLLKENYDFKLIGFRRMAQPLPTETDKNPKPFTLSCNFGYRVNNDKCNARIFVEIHKQEKPKINFIVTVPYEGLYKLRLKNKGKTIFNNSIKLDKDIKNNITLTLDM